MKKPGDNTYEILYQIGRGSYATVHKAINKKTGQLCAIKKLSFSTDLQCLMREIAILSDCECPNIVKFLASSCSDTGVSILMEYCCGGSVRDVINNIGPLSEPQIQVIIRDVLHGLDYLHSKNKIHRDVKAANILLSEGGIAKLGDFGVSEPVDPSPRVPHKIIGTFRWLPPEVINHVPNCNPAIDIWSLGITIIEMGEKQPPYEDLDLNVALEKIANLDETPPTFKEPQLWSTDLKNFLSLCLEKDASCRTSSRQLLTHQLVTKAPSNQILKDLLDQVCKANITNANLEKLSSLTEGLSRESFILLGIFSERRMKLKRVDQKREHLSKVESDIQSLLHEINSRDSSVNEKKMSFKAIISERAKLERERSDLKSTLDSLKNRKIDILDSLTKLKVRQQSLA